VLVAVTALPLIVSIRPISVSLMRPVGAPVAVVVLTRRHGTAAAGIVAETLAVAADADISAAAAAGTDFYASIRRGPMVAILGLRRRRDGTEQNCRRQSDDGKAKRSESPHPHLLKFVISLFPNTGAAHLLPTEHAPGLPALRLH
jgi:hypothetical protein